MNYTPRKPARFIRIKITYGTLYMLRLLTKLNGESGKSDDKGAALLMNREERKEYISGVFSRAADTFDTIGTRVFSLYGKLLVDQLEVPPDSHVLDIACGKGSTMIPMLGRLSREGSVTGIDIAEGMVRNCQERINASGYANVRVVQMDAESLEFDADSFDIVVCGFGIFFFPDVRMAMQEIQRVSTRLARFALSSLSNFPSGQERLDELNKKYGQILRAKLPKQDISTRKQDRAFWPNFGTPDGLVEFLESFSYGNIKIVEKSLTQCYRGKDEWLSSMWSRGRRGVLEQLEEHDYLDKYISEAFEILDEYIVDGRIVSERRALLTTATLRK